jgi:hypothetical protein
MTIILLAASLSWWNMLTNVGLPYIGYTHMSLPLPHSVLSSVVLGSFVKGA